MLIFFRGEDLFNLNFYYLCLFFFFLCFLLVFFFLQIFSFYNGLYFYLSNSNLKRINFIDFSFKLLEVFKIFQFFPYLILKLFFSNKLFFSIRWPLFFGFFFSFYSIIFIICICLIRGILFHFLYFFKILLQIEDMWLRGVLLRAFIICLLSSDFLTFYVVFELINLIFYIFISFTSQVKTIEAGIKYRIFGVLSSVFFLLGIFLFYLLCGSIFFFVINILNIYFFFNNYFFNYFFIGANIFILFAFFIKLGSFPLHGWIIDVYGGRRIISLIIVSLVLKSFFFLLLLKLFSEIIILDEFCYFFLYLRGYFNLLVGTLGGLFQRKIKKIIVYSSITFNGVFFLIISLFEGGFCFPFLIYLVVYILNIFLLFYIFLLFFSLGSFVLIVDEFEFSFFILPFVSIFFFLNIFILVGLPPFLGFRSKIFIFSWLVFSLNFFVSFFFLLVLCFSSIYYRGRIQFIFFFKYLLFELHINLSQKILIRYFISRSLFLYRFFFFLWIFNFIGIFLRNDFFIELGI